MQWTFTTKWNRLFLKYTHNSYTYFVCINCVYVLCAYSIHIFCVYILCVSLVCITLSLQFCLYIWTVNPTAPFSVKRSFAFFLMGWVLQFTRQICFALWWLFCIFSNKVLRECIRFSLIFLCSLASLPLHNEALHKVLCCCFVAYQHSPMCMAL